MERSAVLCVCLCCLAAPAAVLAEGKRPMKIDDLFRFKRVSDPQISPDGKLVVYVVGTVDLDGNKIFVVALARCHRRKGEPRQLTNTHAKRTAIRAGARRQADPLRVQSLRRQPTLDHRPRRRRGPAAHRRSAPRPAPASGRATARRSPSSRRSTPNSPTSRSRRATRSTRNARRRSRKVRQGEGLHTTLLSPLGRLRRGQAAASVRHVAPTAANRRT